jgi:hypothetical protein
MRNRLRLTRYCATPFFIQLISLFAQPCRAGLVTVTFSGSEPGESFSGQLEYNTAGPVCEPCIVQLAGPVELTVSGLTLTSISSSPAAVLSFDGTVNGPEAVHLSFSPYDATTGFNVSGPNATYFNGLGAMVDFDFTIPQAPPTSVPFPSPFPDLTQSISVTFSLEIPFVIEKENFGGETTNVTFATATPEPTTLALLLVATLFFAIRRFRRTSSIL